jgi:hypothetical protein
MMKNIVNKTLLGRWSRSCDAMTAIKVNWANIDHCGTCSKEDLKVYYIATETYTTHAYQQDQHTVDEAIYCIEAYHDLDKPLTKTKNKTNTYKGGIDYFLTRNKW